MKKKQPQSCLRPGCKAKLFSRGLCYRDYMAAWRAVRKRKTTFFELETAGKILPAHDKARNLESWFVKEIKEER